MKRLLRIGSLERDIDEELAFHFAEAVEELKRRGRTQAEAEAEVHRRFGDEARYRSELAIIDRSRERRMQWSDRLDAARNALHHAVRGLARTPGMTIGIVAVFALGVGANATMLEIVDRLLLRPPDHVANADAVHRVIVDRFNPVRGERWQSESLTYPDYRELHQVEAFEAVAGFATRELTLGSGEDAHEVNAVLASGDYFSLLGGARPALGRFFTNEEAKVGGERVAVLGYGYWQSRFSGARDVLGQTIDLGPAPYTIIGVAPRGLTSVDLTPAQVWLPMEVAQADIAGTAWVDSRNWSWLRAVARRTGDASIERAEAEATAVYLAGRAAWERAQNPTDAGGGRAANPQDTRVIPYPLSAAERPNAGAEPTVAKWLAGVALIVLLIACINVANLLFARTLRRQREIGIRLALGVTRARLVGRIVVEGALLGALGGVAALAVAYWGGGFLRKVLLPEVAWDEFALGATVVTLTAVLALLAGVLSALVPALQAARRDVGDVLRTSAGGITRSALRVRSVLSFVQAALSVLLLVGAGLFVRSVANVSDVDHGFDPQNLLFANPIANRGAIPDAERAALNERALERVQALPTVEHAALTSAMPFWSFVVTSVDVEGVDSLQTPTTDGPYVQLVSSDYFATMGMTLVEGGFGDGTNPGAVVNETMAGVIAQAGGVIGRCLYVGGNTDAQATCTPIVGIVEDARRQELRERPTMQYYVNVPPGSTLYAEDVAGATLMLRTRGETSDVMPAVRREILSLDNRLRYVDMAPLQELIEPLARSWKLGATLFMVFGMLALLVAGVGLYSVLAFDVAQRTRELGLRTALGAPVSRLLRMVIGRGMRVTLVGVAAGLLIAALLAPRIEPLLFDVPAFDPVTYLGVAAALLLVALVASWGPAWRASRVDPNVALKAD